MGNGEWEMGNWVTGCRVYGHMDGSAGDSHYSFPIPHSQFPIPNYDVRLSFPDIRRVSIAVGKMVSRNMTSSMAHSSG